MHDTPEKESKHTTDHDRFMTITKFAWDEKVKQIEQLQHQNKQLIEGLQEIIEMHGVGASLIAKIVLQQVQKEEIT